MATSTFEIGNRKLRIETTQINKKKHSVNHCIEWFESHIQQGLSHGYNMDEEIDKHLGVELSIPEYRPSTKLTSFILSE